MSNGELVRCYCGSQQRAKRRQIFSALLVAETPHRLLDLTFGTATPPELSRSRSIDICLDILKDRSFSRRLRSSRFSSSRGSSSGTFPRVPALPLTPDFFEFLLRPLLVDASLEEVEA